MISTVVEQVRATSPVAVPAFAAEVKGKLADLLPIMMIVFGVILTVAWSAGLFWLFLLLLLVLI